MGESEISFHCVKQDKIHNILAVMLGALLTGALWSIRGDHAFGSSWGMFTVALVLCLYIYALWGRKKGDLLSLGITVLLTGITAAGWGTLNSQICGVLSDVSAANSLQINVSPFSGIFMMLCLGFGWMPFFALMTTRYFSGRRYSLKDILSVILVFYITAYICKATVAHGILQLVHPGTGKLFSMGLFDGGILDSPYAVYLKHFDNISWAKKFLGGRNYFTSVETVSHALGSAATILFVRFKLKDKLSAILMTLVNTAMALAITIADIFMYLAGGGYRLTQFSASDSPILRDLTARGLIGWPMWEYATGFLFGLFFMLILIRLKPRNDTSDILLEKSNLKFRDILTFLITCAFAIGAVMIRPLVMNFDVHKNNVTADGFNLTYAYIMAGVIGLAIAVPIYILFWKRKQRGLISENAFTEFCTYAWMALILYFTVADLFICPAESRLKLADITHFSISWLVVYSSLASVILGLILVKRNHRHKRKLEML